MANAPLYPRRSALLAKAETMVGTQIAVTGSDGVFNAMNVVFEDDIDFAKRESQGSASKMTGYRGPLAGRCTFQIELIGGSSAPAWMSTFLPAVGMPLSSLIASPQTKPPEASGATTKTLTLAGYQDGLLKVLFGCMGNAVFHFPAGRKAFVEFTFRGIWGDPTDVALPSVSWPTTLPLRVASSALTIGSASPIFSDLVIDLGNDVQVRESGQTATGFHSAVIPTRDIVATLTAESRLVADWDIYGKRKANTEEALAMALGTAGNALAFAAPKAQISKISPTIINGVRGDVIALDFNKSASAGDDEFTITTS